MPDSTQESSALSEILNRLKAIETKVEKVESKLDKHIEDVGYAFKLAAADRPIIEKEMDKRFKEVDKRFDSVAGASGMREGFMAAAADREAIRLEMRESLRTAAERHEKFKNKTEENNAEFIRIIADVGTMTYDKIDANHQEVKVFQKSAIEALESINQSLKRFAHLEERAKRGSKEKFEHAMAKIPDVEPEEYDKI